MPVTHRITIHTDGHRYRTAGAIAITAANPMRAAGAALLELGHDPADRLRGVFEGAMISPVALSRLAKPYSPQRLNHRDGAGGRNVD
jgi:hypothetical protein